MIRSPMQTRRSFLAAAAAATSLPSFSQVGSAPTTLIVPFSAGSQADILARKYSLHAAEGGGAPWLVENLPGAAGVLASRQLLKRPADGRSLLWGTSGVVCSAPVMANPPLEYDPTADFAPVCIFANSPFVLFVGKDSPANDLRGLQALARDAGVPLTYVGGDTGSANQIAAETLLRRLSARGTHIPYRNNQQAYIDVSEGRVQFGVFGYTNIAPLAKAGKVRILSVLSDRPLAADPQLPTVASQGLGAFDVKGWYGLFAARGTPDDALAQHERTMAEVLRTKGFADFLVDSGQEVAFRDRQAAAQFVEIETRRYRTVLKNLKLI
jgi:tripartite-type tricarboxylate transporter receptor subunit TctC